MLTDISIWTHDGTIIKQHQMTTWPHRFNSNSG